MRSTIAVGGGHSPLPFNGIPFSMNICFILTGAAAVLLLTGCVTKEPADSELPGRSNSYRKQYHTMETRELLVQGLNRTK